MKGPGRLSPVEGGRGQLVSRPRWQAVAREEHHFGADKVGPPDESGRLDQAPDQLGSAFLHRRIRRKIRGVLPSAARRDEVSHE